MEYWGYDPIRKAYTFSYFNSLGESGSGTLTNSANVWTTNSSGITVDGKNARGRCTLTLTGSVLAFKCEASGDGKVWAPSAEGKSTKGK